MTKKKRTFMQLFGDTILQICWFIVAIIIVIGLTLISILIFTIVLEIAYEILGKETIESLKILFGIFAFIFLITLFRWYYGE